MREVSGSEPQNPRQTMRIGLGNDLDPRVPALETSLNYVIALELSSNPGRDFLLASLSLP